MTAVVVSNKTNGIFRRAFGEIFKMNEPFSKQDFINPFRFGIISNKPDRRIAFVRCSAILSLLKINIGGTKLPVALMQQTTVVLVPRSPLLPTATLALPHFARILESLATIETPVSSTLYILEGLIAKKVC